MNDDFRRRVLLPLVIPFGVLGAVLLFAFSVSRVLITVNAELAAVIALALAGYVFFLGFVIERQPRLTGRALAIGVTVGLVAVGSAGVVAAAAGPREIEEHGAEDAAEDAAQDAAQDDGAAAAEEIPEDAVVFAAGNDIGWDEVPESIPAGEVEVALVTDSLPHNVVFEGVDGDSPVAEGNEPGVHLGTVTLEAGEYDYLCSIPGHEAGMTGTVTVE